VTDEICVGDIVFYAHHLGRTLEECFSRIRYGIVTKDTCDDGDDAAWLRYTVMWADDVAKRKLGNLFSESELRKPT
jgi:hypothetical protein